jgi:hypothetical protein
MQNRMLNGATTFSKTTLGIMTIIIMGLFMTHVINDDIKLTTLITMAYLRHSAKNDNMNK